MISDMDIPWIALKDNNETEGPPWSGFMDVTDDDADGSLEDDDVAVTSALDSMIIDDSPTSVRPTPSVGDAILPKRKRTSSQVSPPKVSHSCTIVGITLMYIRRMAGEVLLSVAGMVHTISSNLRLRYSR